MQDIYADRQSSGTLSLQSGLSDLGLGLIYLDESYSTICRESMYLHTL